MSEPQFKIDTSNRWRRNWLRFLAFTYPFWGLTAAVYFILWCGNGSPPDSSTPTALWTYMSPFLLIGGHSALLMLCFDSLEAKGGLLVFPGPLLRRNKLANLRKVFLDRDELVFRFEDTEKTLDKVNDYSLSLSRIKGRDRVRLVDFLLDKAPHCLIDEHHRKALENFEELEDFDPEKTLRLPYDSHSKRKAFFEVCLHYEKFFWFIWGGFCSAAAVFLAPIVLFAILYVPHRALNPGKPFIPPFPIEEWAKLWFTPLGKLVEPSASVLSKLGSFLEQNPAASIGLVLLSLYFLYQALKLLAKPDALVLEKTGLRLDCKWLGWLLFHDIQWKDCRKLRLAKLSDTVKETRVQFCGDSDSVLLEFELRGITKQGHKQLIARAIDQWAPHVEMDAEFLELVQPSSRQSYTELWLQSLNTPPKRDRLSPLKPGEFLQNGEYQILDTVGAGGQGIAYLAERSDRASGSTELVVVKEFVLPVYVDRRARQQALERFEKESATLQTLRHKNVVGLKDHFIEDHRAYLVLERINGKSLRKLAEGNGFREDAFIANLLEQICDILIYLQERETPLVHRDFTPDNLILDEAGNLKLIDFNLARQDSTNKSRIGVVGKHAYMPPEQFAGRPTIQSDIYALGASLYFLLAGRDPEPFSQSSMPEEAASMNPLWGELISACTNLDLNVRLKSAREVKDFLEGAGSKGAGESIEIRQQEEEVLNG